MTLEDAIKHCKEVAEHLSLSGGCDKSQCGAEHLQLAEWLEQLQCYREVEKQQIADSSKLMVKSPYDKNGYLPKCLCVISRDEIDGVFSCEEHCSHYNADCGKCGIQKVFNKLGIIENNIFFATCISNQDALVELFKLMSLCNLNMWTIVDLVLKLSPCIKRLSPIDAASGLNKIISATSTLDHDEIKNLPSIAKEFEYIKNREKQVQK